jgi:hypothetical protein
MVRKGRNDGQIGASAPPDDEAGIFPFACVAVDVETDLVYEGELEDVPRKGRGLGAVRENSGVCANDDDANEMGHELEHEEAGGGGMSQKARVSLRTVVCNEPLPPTSMREM